MMRAFCISQNLRASRLLLAVLLGGLAILASPPGKAAEPAKEDAQKPAAPPAEQRMGRLIPITLPITGRNLEQIRKSVRRALDQARTAHVRPVLILEFRVLPNQEEFGRGSEFGSAYELANFLSGEELNEAKTVAFIPQSIQGHAVLVALACDEIIMASEAEIGNAGVDTPEISPAIQAAYKDIANRRKTVPAEVALGLVDPAQEIWKVETEVSREYVTREGLEELRKHHTVRVDEKPLFAAGQPGQLSGSEARELDFVSYLAKDRMEVAKALGLPPESVKEDPSLQGAWKAVRIDIKGRIHAEMISHAQRLIRDALKDKEVNFVCLWIDSPGGSPVDSLQLATFLAFDLDPSEVRTVAYIPNEARSDAALIALACDQVIMHPRAVLGGSGDYAYDDGEIDQIRKTIREELAPRKSRSWSLIAAMIDPKLEVFRYLQPGGEAAFFSQEEFQQQPDQAKWAKGEQIAGTGKPLLVEGKAAVEYRLADEVVDGFTQFKQLYGLENDPALLEPSWADFLVSWLAAPGIAFVLLTIGFIALYIELQAPGIGVGGFVAALCFLIFFWSMFLGGTAGWLEVLLFLAGVGFLLVEVFVLPGFGVFGLGGGLLVIISLILASQTFIFPRNDYQFAELQHTLLMIAGVTVGTFVAALLLNYYLPHAPMLGRVMLAPPSDEETALIDRRAALVDYGSDLVGAQGITITPLVPSGKARFGDRLLDVMADGGEAIPRGAAVEIVEVHGNRVLVRATDELA
jgi:membrane-bound ClpP family serine protease